MPRDGCQLLIAGLLVLALPAIAQDRFILRPSAQGEITELALQHALTVIQPLDSNRQVYLVTSSDSRTPDEVEKEVGSDVGVVGIEVDQRAAVPELSQTTAAILDGLPAASAVTYYGVPVLGAYLSQTAASLIRISDAQSTFGTTGAGMVAIIDTGIDPTHPGLQGSIVPGYDFVNDIPGSASEWIDLTSTNRDVLSKSSPVITSKNTVAMVSQTTAAILDQTTAAILDYRHMPKAFGHGTMVAGIVHLTAPTAQIMPLKAFRGDGTANLSDILRAIYYASDHGARVINMSFNLVTPSIELEGAIDYAEGKGLICVASAGNTGTASVGSPANLPYVIGVASTTSLDQRSTFSSYDAGVFVAAPGENVITTYPGRNYAEATGTSFSAPFVSGTASLTVQLNNLIGFEDSSAAIGNAKSLPPSLGLGHGRLDVYQAVQFAAQKQ
jgi:subtilisin family serine protease